MIREYLDRAERLLDQGAMIGAVAPLFQAVREMAETIRVVLEKLDPPAAEPKGFPPLGTLLMAHCPVCGRTDYRNRMAAKTPGRHLAPQGMLCEGVVELVEYRLAGD